MRTMTNNEPARTEPAPADRDWFGGRRWTGILAVSVVILVALCIVLVVVVNHGSNRNTAATPSHSTTPPPTGSTRASTSALPSSVPTIAPAGTRWNIYQTVALPSLPGAGPREIHGAIATGYTQSPLGALIATANESYRFVLAPDNQWRQAADEMLANTAGKTVWLKNRAAHPYGTGGPTSNGDSFAQIAGYQFVSYTPSDAVIQLVTRDSSGTLQVGADHVRWDGTDWRFVPASNGGINANVQTVDSLAGFIEWKGV